MALDSLSRFVLLLAVIIPINADIVFLPAKAKSAWVISKSAMTIISALMIPVTRSKVARMPTIQLNAMTEISAP